MYFTGSLAVDPSQITDIKVLKPTKVFGKILHLMTGGATSEKEEQETFTAVAILQQINMALRSVGINNLVRLTKDDFDFYFDEEGKEDDLKEIMENFSLETDKIESEVFETLYLVVEHQDVHFKYLIEVDIKRRHKVGEYPIEVKVNGVMADMGGNGSSESTKEKMEKVFQSQELYNKYLLEKQNAFESFVSTLGQSVRKFISADDLIQKVKQNMIRPKKPVQKTKSIPQHRDNHSVQPIYYGYYGFNDYFLYSWMWSSMAYSNGIYVNNFYMVDESGQDMMSVGEEGFDAGSTDTLNPEADFEPPDTGDVEYFNDHDYQDEFQESNVGDAGGGGDAGGEDSGGWSDSFGDSSSGDSSSSCSSCSSCGGGCGGD